MSAKVFVPQSAAVAFPVEKGVAKLVSLDGSLFTTLKWDGLPVSLSKKGLKITAREPMTMGGHAYTVVHYSQPLPRCARRPQPQPQPAAVAKAQAATKQAVVSSIKEQMAAQGLPQEVIEAATWGLPLPEAREKLPVDETCFKWTPGCAEPPKGKNWLRRLFDRLMSR